MGFFSSILDLRIAAEDSASSLPELRLQAEEIAKNVIHGMHAQKKSGAGEKFWQFREYSPSDRPQDIDWRQSAKGDDVFIRQKEWQTTQKTYLWCANGRSMDFASDEKLMQKQDTAHLITLALALLLKENEEQIGLFGSTKTGRSNTHIDKIAQSLVKNQNENSLPYSQSFVLPQASTFIAIGDFLSPIDEIEHAFTAIRSKTKTGIIVQVLDPAELNLPYQGRIKFNGLKETQTINNVSAVKAAYSKRIEGHLKSIRSLCEEKSWQHIIHSTATDPKETLRKIIAFEGAAS